MYSIRHIPGELRIFQVRLFVNSTAKGFFYSDRFMLCVNDMVDERFGGQLWSW